MSRWLVLAVLASAAWSCGGGELTVGEAQFVDGRGTRRVPVVVATWRDDVARIIAGTTCDDLWTYTNWPSWQTQSCASCQDGTFQLVPGSVWQPACGYVRTPTAGSWSDCDGEMTVTELDPVMRVTISVGGSSPATVQLAAVRLVMDAPPLAQPAPVCPAGDLLERAACCPDGTTTADNWPACAFDTVCSALYTQKRW